MPQTTITHHGDLVRSQRDLAKLRAHESGPRSGEPVLPRRQGTELEPALLPLFRAGFYVMFAFVLLHKSNTSFLDPSASCAVIHFDAFTDRLPWIPKAESLGIVGALPVLTWLLEGSIPVLLFFKRSRQLALYAAFVFHYMMAINGFQGFSAFALSMYVPFLPRDLHRQVADAYRVARERFRGAALFNVVLIFTTIFVAICYPITGSWKWGGGWLDQLGFYDFAGSTLVHSVGGWAALVGAIILGPRLGKPWACSFTALSRFSF